MKKHVSATLLLTLPLQAFAHLTWIDSGKQSIGLSTGHNFPAKEITVKGEYVDFIQCKGEQRGVFQLAFNKDSMRYSFPEKPQNCLARLKTSLIELTPAQGVQHFQENKVKQDLIDKAKAVPVFREEYFKLAQLAPVEIGSALYRPELAQFVYKPGEPDTLYVYQSDQPVAGLPVGLEYPETPITLWSNTDTDGKVKLLMKPRSKALLRTLVVEDGDPFKSQFLSVILEPR
ncbi:MAG TPA: hypothetical protein VFV28_05410 [Limnobacter sp.]|nr:hypothetical protein [Limnobacter sp.]